MTTPTDRILCNWYQGEAAGHALFHEVARLSVDGGLREKWLELARLEKAMEQELSNILVSRGVPRPASAAAEGTRAAIEISSKPWIEQMGWMSATARRALEQMSSEAAAMPPLLYDLGALMLEHEAALVEFADRELAGDGLRSLATLRALVERLAGPGPGRL